MPRLGAALRQLLSTFLAFITADSGAPNGTADRSTHRCADSPQPRFSHSETPNPARLLTAAQCAAPRPQPPSLFTAPAASSRLPSRLSSSPPSAELGLPSGAGPRLWHYACLTENLLSPLSTPFALARGWRCRDCMAITHTPKPASCTPLLPTLSFSLGSVATPGSTLGVSLSSAPRAHSNAVSRAV